MRRSNSGCCILFLCILFLIPGLFLLRDQLPKLDTVQEKEREVQDKVTDFIDEITGEKEKREEIRRQEIEKLLEEGESVNGCSYFYWNLEEDIRAEYMKILDGLKSMAPDIDVQLETDTMNSVVKMVFADHPELFFAEQSYRYTDYSTHIVIHPEYNCSEEERMRRQEQVEETLVEAVQTIPEGASVYGSMKALYGYVVNTVEYNESAPDNQNLYSSMVNRISVCTGYAKELQYLLQRIGIQAVCAEGTVVDRGPHAWVIANLEGEYVHLDPTFGDPSYEEEMEGGLDDLPPELQVDYSYLCCGDSQILKNRIMSEDITFPGCPSDEWEYYTLQGRYFTEYSDEVLISVQDSIDREENYWEGQFATREAWQTMIDRMQEGTFADMVLANHPDWTSVHMHMSYREDSYVIKLWY